MSDSSQPNEPLFQTPNPIELKEAAQQDPIHERASAQESDTNDDEINTSEAGVDRLGVAEMEGSQVIRANVSGH